MFKEAAEWGQVIVAINSDEWLMRKKGYVFMPWEERAEIIGEFASVSVVSSFDDSDDTACDAIRKFPTCRFCKWWRPKKRKHTRNGTM